VGHVSRSSSLLDVEASLARVFQSGLKTDRGVMMGSARKPAGARLIFHWSRSRA
jgi:hypothetical protein